MGSVYVPVDVANAGIMPMDASGGGGQTGGGFWINWIATGYSGNGWFWDKPNNYLKDGWAAAVDNGGGYVGDGCNGDGSNQPHTSEFESFLIHIQNGHSENLNAILGSWPNDKKFDFVSTNKDALEGCVTFTAS